jgi:secreted trypsin-like serine protease
MKKIFIILSLVAIAVYGLPSEDYNSIQNEIKIASENITPTITNGTRATLGQFPYQVAITMNIGGGQGVCGGVLIRQRWVLTVSVLNTKSTIQIH